MQKLNSLVDVIRIEKYTFDINLKNKLESHGKIVSIESIESRNIVF